MTKRVALPTLMVLLATLATYSLVFIQVGSRSSSPGQLRGAPATAQPAPQHSDEKPASSTRRSAGAVAGVAVLGLLLGFPTVSKAGPDKEKPEKPAPTKAERIAKQKAQVEEEAKKYKMNDQGTLKKVVAD